MYMNEINLILSELKNMEISQFFVTNYNLLFILAILLCFMHYKFKIIGFLLSILLFFLAPLLYYSDEYILSTFVKFYLIICFSVLAFSKLNFNLDINVNSILWLLAFLNVFILIFNNNDILITILLILTSISVPYICVSGKNIQMKKMLLNVDLFVILYSFVIAYYVISNDSFQEHLSLNLLALLLPLISHFVNNKFMETRSLLLVFLLLFDIIDIKNYGL